MKRWGTLLLICGLLLGLTACAADKRTSGKTYEAEGFESALSTAFFDFQVNAAALADSLESYEPRDPQKRFLIVSVTVTSTFAEESAIPMFDTDFALTWPGMEGEPIYCEQNFASTQLPEEYEIRKGESRTGDLVFVVPREQSAFALEYLEIYEDEFEGNTFVVRFEAGERESAEEQ